MEQIPVVKITIKTGDRRNMMLPKVTWDKIVAEKGNGEGGVRWELQRPAVPNIAETNLGKAVKDVNLSPETKAPPKVKTEGLSIAEMTLPELQQAFKKKFGKKPNHLMGEKKLREKLIA